MINLKNIRVAVFAASTFLLTACGGGSLDQIIQNNLYPAEAVNRKYPVPATPPAGYSEVYIDLQDAAGQPYRVHSWIYEHPSSASVNTLVYFHGNGENLQALYEVNFLEKMKSLNVNFIVMDYPMYGRSTGKTEEAYLVGGAKATIDFARTKFPQNELIVWGRSIGASVATLAYAEKQSLAKGLVLTSPWTNLYEAAVNMTSLAKQVSPEWYAKNGYKTDETASQISAPVLIHHGVKDELVPVAMGRTVSTKFGNTTLVEMVEFATRGHNDIFAEQPMWQDIRDFSAR